MEKYVVAIPSRLGSTRLPNKAVLDINGIPMIRRVCMQALKSNAAEVIACIDDEKIKEAIGSLDRVRVCMTDSDLKSGTDRIAMMLRTFDIDPETIVVNVQGDEPLINPEHIEHVVRVLIETQSDMSTLCDRIENNDDIFDPNCVKVVMNKKGRALYFSRCPIPYERDNFGKNNKIEASHYHHIGIYCYRAKTVLEFAAMEQSSLEKAESLEQLRMLENGYSIGVGITQNPPERGVDTQEDLEKIRRIIAKKEA